MPGVSIVTVISRRRRTLGPVECEGAAGVVGASNALAMVEHVARVPAGFDCQQPRIVLP